MFCGGDTDFFVAIEGKVCLPCGDKLQTHEIMVLSMDRYKNLKNRQQEISAEAFIKWLGYQSTVVTVKGTEGGHQFRRDVSLSDALTDFLAQSAEKEDNESTQDKE